MCNSDFGVFDEEMNVEILKGWLLLEFVVKLIKFWGVVFCI